MIPIGIITNFLNLLFSILYMTILAEVILSYVPSLKESQFYKILESFNYPVLEPFRKIQEKFIGESMIDFSPILAWIFLGLIKDILIR